MADNAGLSAALDGIPMVADAAARDARFPLATRKQNQRVFRLDTLVQQRWSGSVWVDDLTAVVTPQQFGAPADGTTDDAAAITAAATALASGGRIRFPRGTYRITSQVTIPHDGITLEFEPGATINATISNTSNGVFYCDTKNNFAVIGGAFSGAFPWAVYIAGGSGHRVEGNTITGGTVASSGKCGGIYLQDCSDFRVLDNDISGCGDATLDAGADIQCNNGATYVTDGWIERNRCTSTNVVFNLLCFNPLRVKVRGNTCSGARVYASTTTTGGYGILLYQTDGADPALIGDNIIADNLVSATQGNGIYNQDGVARTQIVNNAVRAVCTVQTEASLAVAGIVANGANGLIATNRVSACVKSGIILSNNASHTLVTGNQIVDPVLDGIVIQGNITDVGIVSNRVSGIGTGRLAIGHHSFVDHATARIAIHDNVMFNVTHAIWLGASDDSSSAINNRSTGLTDLGYIASLTGTNAIVQGNVGNGISFPEGVSADRGDANRTLVAGVDYQVQRFATALTANRTITLSSTNARNGARFRVVRTGLGSFTLDVGGVKTIPSATAAYVDVVHDGTAWRLAGYGAL